MPNNSNRTLILSKPSSMHSCTVLVILLFAKVATPYAQQQQQNINIEPQPDVCLSQKCGGIKVSYPFKLKNATRCPSFSPFFELECVAKTGYLLFNKTEVNGTVGTSLRVLALTKDSIALDVTSIRIAMKTTSNHTCEGDSISLLFPPFPSPYVLDDENKFGSFGCSYGVLLTVNPAKNISSVFDYNNVSSYADMNVGGCDMLCPSGDNNPECGFNRCCVYHWPRSSYPRWILYAAVRSYFSTAAYDPQTCASNYATLFHSAYSNFHSQNYGLKLRWALPSNITTARGISQSPDFACSNNSIISMVQEIPGYLCSCLPGYTGDGYAQGFKCSDIDECNEIVQNDCLEGQTTCHNTDGNYKCKCDSPFHVGDGRKSGSGCYFSPTIRNALVISSSIIGLIVAIGCFFTIQVHLRKSLKRKYFKQNGGTQLQKLLLMGSSGEDLRKLFTIEELEAATKTFSNDMKLGVGGFGTVFKGVLADGRVVAVKKANKGGDRTQFMNELEIMVQINHKNIVKFLGCCIETMDPLLVYEYVSNGDVMENLKEENPFVMDWQHRLKVATQITEALAYLHGAAVPPILHRDVKSSNVLLDNNFDAKVADFGVSRLVPEGATHVSTAVQGTIGYLDPEYFQTLQLTEKSDVYSLGVMLVELITGLKPVDNHNREQRFANLALLFVQYMREGRVEDLIDPRLHFDLNQTRSSIQAVAVLALSCLSMHGSQRPVMRRVGEELHLITRNFLNIKKQVQPHAEVRHPSNFGAVVAQYKRYGVESGKEPSSSSSSSSVCMDSALLNCTMPR